jgi:hypothetical protein
LTSLFFDQKYVNFEEMQQALNEYVKYEYAFINFVFPKVGYRAQQTAE